MVEKDHAAHTPSYTYAIRRHARGDGIFRQKSRVGSLRTQAAIAGLFLILVYSLALVVREPQQAVSAEPASGTLSMQDTGETPDRGRIESTEGAVAPTSSADQA